jgi:patatin-like phospholipase/acyl hydrolase
MKGMATVRLLRELERHSGRRIPDMFDLIGGAAAGWLGLRLAGAVAWRLRCMCGSA